MPPKIRSRVNFRPWFNQNKNRLNLWLGMMNPLFFKKLRQQIDTMTQFECNTNTSSVKQLFNGETLDVHQCEGDRLYVLNEFLTNQVFIGILDEKVKIWLKYAVACLVLKNVAIIREDIVHFFWRPILSASTSPHMKAWVVNQFGLGKI